jgi:GTP-binding protein HflX
VPGTFFGSGQVERLAGAVEQDGIGLVVVDGALSPGQQRNLERAWKAKVLDRPGLILERFGARARTREGALQVERAALAYQRSRLVRSWTHLERQRGGFGFLGGPGESQLEIDRRLIADRIDHIDRALERVQRTRAQQRKGRTEPVVALVGYTNAGKSTLFNRLTQAGVFAENLLFATLDPTMRRVTLPNGRAFVLSDTVGFISDLPTQLVAAFRATLEEVLEADLVLHVRDAAHPDSAAQREDVRAVLSELGLDPDEPERVIEVLNKIDLLPDDIRASLLEQAARDSALVALSSATGEGIERLQSRLEERLGRGERILELTLPLSDGATLAWLYAHGQVLARRDKGLNALLTVRLQQADAARLERKLNGNGAG